MMRLFATFALVLALPSLAAAQATSFSFTSKDSDDPINITYELEAVWDSNKRVAIARGKATATQGDTRIVADELIAHFRDNTAKARPVADGAASEADNNELYRVDAVGSVTITTRGDTATGAAAVYDFDKKAVVLIGSPVTMTSMDGTVTAQQRLQYWPEQNVAVAEGDAVAVDTTAKGAGRRVRADKLIAFFRDAADDNSKKTPSARGRDLFFLQGDGKVVLNTKTETVHGDRLLYNLETGDVNLNGNVKMQQGKGNYGTGPCAFGNINNNVRITVPGTAATGACAPGRVRALIAPKAKTDDPPQPVGAKP